MPKMRFGRKFSLFQASSIARRVLPFILCSAQIDMGEEAVIRTVLDEARDAVILDDLKARRIALTLGLQVTGTLGILLQAKQSGHLPSVKNAIAALEKRGMWIAPALVAKAIRLAGE